VFYVKVVGIVIVKHFDLNASDRIKVQFPRTNLDLQHADNQFGIDGQGAVLAGQLVRSVVGFLAPNGGSRIEIKINYIAVAERPLGIQTASEFLCDDMPLRV